MTVAFTGTATIDEVFTEQEIAVLNAFSHGRVVDATLPPCTHQLQIGRSTDQCDLHWCCTRQMGHKGAHVAWDGRRAVAAWTQE